MTFAGQLKALVYFHLQEHKSARHLIRDMKESDFAKQNIAPDGGISRSSFSEAINHRGKELGNLVSIDGSLINAVLSMRWADYRKAPKKLRLIADLTLIVESPIRSSLQKAMVVNALLSIKSSL